MLDLAKFYSNKISDYSKDPDYLLKRADVYHAAGNYDLEELTFLDIIDQSLSSLEAYLPLADLYLNQKRYQDQQVVH